MGAIGAGLLVLLGVERDDSEAEAARLAERVLGYRVFADSAGKMNLSVKDTSGGLLVVPQFTLVADTNSGTRPSFSSGASPEGGVSTGALWKKPEPGMRAWKPDASRRT